MGANFPGDRGIHARPAPQQTQAEAEDKSDGSHAQPQCLRAPVNHLGCGAAKQRNLGQGNHDCGDVGDHTERAYLTDAEELNAE